MVCWTLSMQFIKYQFLLMVTNFFKRTINLFKNYFVYNNIYKMEKFYNEHKKDRAIIKIANLKDYEDLTNSEMKKIKEMRDEIMSREDNRPTKQEYFRKYYMEHRGDLIEKQRRYRAEIREQKIEERKEAKEERIKAKITLMINTMNKLKKCIYDKRTLKKYNIVCENGKYKLQI